MAIQKKYKQVFYFIYLITGALRKLWYKMRKAPCKINGKNGDLLDLINLLIANMWLIPKTF